MESINAVEIIMAVALGMAAFFMKAFYNRLNDAVSSINELNKNVAVAVTNQNHTIERVKKLDAETERLWKQSDRTREVIHDIKNDMAQMKLNTIEIENLKKVKQC